MTTTFRTSLTPCLELAIEGERLCRAGKLQNGIECFRSALSTGTDDVHCLSAIYCQLGNAYFCCQLYEQALEYHRWDLTLAKLTGDLMGEAQACGNLGNTLKMLGKHEEAIVCFNRQLDLGKQLDKKQIQARALYNIGNVYHAKGKQWASHTNGHSESAGLPPEAAEAQRMAVDYYTQNLKLVRELGDRPAEGRVHGNLGNTHYLLGNFHEAVECHKQRLNFANEFGDLAAQRRAYSNLGNACIFLADFESAADYYRHALRLAQQLNDPALEAQACYSLGNTHTLLRDPASALIYHLRHLVIARRLGDRVGEGRAHWSLTNAYTALGRFDMGLRCAHRHRLIARQLGDTTGLMTAQLMIREVRHLMSDSNVGAQSATANATSSSSEHNNTSSSTATGGSTHSVEHHRQSVDSSQRSLIVRAASDDFEDEYEDLDGDLDADLERELEMTAPDVLDSVEVVTARENGRTTAVRFGYLDFPSPANPLTDAKRDDLFPNHHLVQTVDSENQLESVGSSAASRSMAGRSNVDPAIREDEEEQFEDPQELFFSLLLTSQSRRMDEQRCCLRVAPVNGDVAPSASSSQPRPPSPPPRPANGVRGAPLQQDEALFDLIEGVQGDRMDDQRATLPAFPGLRAGPGCLPRMDSTSLSSTRLAASGTGEPIRRAASVVAGALREPDDEFLEMILRLQTSTRINDQRSNLPDPLCRVTSEPDTDSSPNGTTPVDSAVTHRLGSSNPSCTVPDEDFFALIQRVQSTRLDEQRCNPPPVATTDNLAAPSPPDTGSGSPGSTGRRVGSWRRKRQ